MNNSPLDYRESVRASERWSAAHNLRSTLSTLLTLHVLLATIAALLLVSCRKSDADAKPADVDYYTCTMHPSVKKQNPTDKCPICSMDHVPVKKREVTASEHPGVETPHVRHTPDAPRSALHAQHEVGAVRESVAQPAEFTVPVERQQQI